jgi:hypothetical protein
VKYDTGVLFSKTSERIWVSLHSDNKGYVAWRRLYTCYNTVSGWIFLRMRNVWDRSCKESQKHTFCVQYLFLANRAV